MSSTNGLRGLSIYVEVTPSGFGFPLVKTFLAGAGNCSGTYCVHLIQVDGSTITSYGLGGFSSGYFSAALISTDSSLIVAGLCPPVSFVGSSVSCVVKFRNNTTVHSIDTSFGMNGRAGFNIGVHGGQDRAYASAVSPDGKLVVVGECFAPDQGACVARFLPNGTFDTTFAGKGFVRNLFGEVGAPTVSAVRRRSGRAIAFDGTGMVVAGMCNDAVCLVRLNEDGSHDASFGSAGLVSIPVGCSSATTLGEVMSISADGGKTTVSAGCGDTNGQLSALYFRLMPNGTMDLSFNGGSLLRTSTGPVGGYLNYSPTQFGAAIAGGKLVAAGANPGLGSFVVSRMESNGSADQSFGTGGAVRIQAFSMNAMISRVVAAGQKIVAASTCGSAFCAVRLHADGSIDTSFGNSGTAVAQVGDGSHLLTAISAHGEKLVLSGRCNLQNVARFCIAVLNPDGSLDTAFGGTGKASFAPGSGSRELDAHTIANGFAYLVGSCLKPNEGFSDICIAAVELSSPVAAPTAPGRPAITSLAPGNGTLTATIDPPASQGGLAITQFSVTCTPGNSTVMAAGNVVPITGLNNGTAYTCSAMAMNSAGTSAASTPKTATPTSVVLTSARLRQQHGTAGSFDLNLARTPLSGGASVEPREAYSHRLILDFNETISSHDTGTATLGNGQTAGTVSIFGLNSSTLEIELSGIADQSAVRVRIPGINGAYDFEIPIAFQIGNTGSAQFNEQLLSLAGVSAADIATLKSRLAVSVPVNANNFIFDINRDGVIDLRDVAIAKSRSGRRLPR